MLMNDQKRQWFLSLCKGRAVRRRRIVGTSVADAVGMKQPIIFALILIVLSLLGLPLSAASQGTQRISRTTLAGMDVLSRARLFEATIEKAARSEGVDPRILWTIAYNETRFRPWLTSPKNAQGMMQFMPATAARFGLADPYEPTSSIRAAARYVKYLGRLFDWNLESVLAAYNAGEGTVLAYIQGRELRSNGKLINASRRRTTNGVPPYKETVGYVSQGVKVYRWLKEQGRLSSFSPPETIAKTSEIPSAANAQERQAISVFYDPRTGKRRVVSLNNSVSAPLLDFGPVIVGPSIPKNSTQLARSTFAGKNPHVGLQK
ncbi:MAG TPA: lytic transglycosylase domain-containing protein [Pyrinomonadaceae bacterium]|nr:lytic transglycosylase domain-containing protein [Pyrinomonadaceae bacterium]